MRIIKNRSIVADHWRHVDDSKVLRDVRSGEGEGVESLRRRAAQVLFCGAAGMISLRPRLRPGTAGRLLFPSPVTLTGKLEARPRLAPKDG